MSPKVQDPIKNVKRNDAPTSNSRAPFVGTSLRLVQLPKQHSTKAKPNKNNFREGFLAAFIFGLFKFY
jgi:hypothetical protein